MQQERKSNIFYFSLFMSILRQRIAFVYSSQISVLFSLVTKIFLFLLITSVIAWFLVNIAYWLSYH